MVRKEVYLLISNGGFLEFKAQSWIFDIKTYDLIMRIKIFFNVPMEMMQNICYLGLSIHVTTKGQWCTKDVKNLYFPAFARSWGYC